MAVTKSPWVKNLMGADKPFRLWLKVQAGSTQAIKRGEICTYNETSGYMQPADAVADAQYKLAISDEEQFSTYPTSAPTLERYMPFIIPREYDVFEFELATARQVADGDTFILTASNSQKLTYAVTSTPVAFAAGNPNVPESGTTLRSLSYAQVIFNPAVSFWRCVHRDLPLMVHHTAAATLLAEQSGSVHTNLGASGSVTLTLPQSPAAGTWFEFVLMADQALVLEPSSAGGIYIKGAKQTDDKYISMTDIGDFCKLMADGNGDWVAVNSISGADADITVES